MTFCSSHSQETAEPSSSSLVAQSGGVNAVGPQLDEDYNFTRHSEAYCTGVADYETYVSGGESDGEMFATPSRPCQVQAVSLATRGRAFEVKYSRDGQDDPLTLTRSYGGFSRSSQTWPLPCEGSTSAKFWFYPRQQSFKFGGCPEHPNRALVPRVCEDVPRWSGTVRLYCSGVFERTPSGWRKCLCSFPYDMQFYNALPIDVRDTYKSLAKAFKRGACGR